MPALLATSPSPALRDQIPQSTFLRARSPGLCPGGSVIANRRVLSTAACCPVGPVFNASLGVWIGGDFWDSRVPDLSTQAQQPPINAKTDNIDATALVSLVPA